ncbi:MAG: Mur ligase family protein [Firmicutes bacterium]|nr:Mur ligase family protein [Bacillota bacterium]
MTLVYSLVDALLLSALSYECFRVLQSSSYRLERGYFKLLLSVYFAALAAVQAAVITLRFYGVPHYVSSIIYGAAALPFLLIKRKCPLKITKRVCRLFAAQFVILFVLSFFALSVYCVVFLPFLTALSLLLCLPTDLIIARYYIKKARLKLEKSNADVIAITGSYGKTSVKDMLAVLLDCSLAPCGSCNTPLGIAAFINKADLTGVKYVILEFGARNKGDIAQLCKLYKPKYGIVTGVCAQHLSTFKTFERVVETKRELVEYLPCNGLCVLNYADEYARSFVSYGVCSKVLSDDKTDVEAVKTDFDGTTLAVRVDGKEYDVTLPQISAYVADTFAMCLRMTLSLSQDLEHTLARASDVVQTPHRMELLKTAAGYVIDDSYNGSIAGVTSCAKTLKNFNCVKTVITQGLAECGRDRRRQNAECGKILGEACDVAIVLGKNAKYLLEGLRLTNCKVLRAKSVAEAVELSKPYAVNGILLFQNDLPDSVNVA